MQSEPTVEIVPTVEFIKDLVPLRSPILMVDRVHEWVPGESITASKCFTEHEPVFGVAGAFSRPPEAMMVEAMVQVAGLTMPKRPGRYVYLLGLDKVEIDRRVEYGDVMTTVAQKKWLRSNMFCIRATSSIQGAIPVISGEIMYVYLPSPQDS